MHYINLHFTYLLTYLPAAPHLCSGVGKTKRNGLHHQSTDR